jgi:hypothetical protein
MVAIASCCGCDLLANRRALACQDGEFSARRVVFAAGNGVFRRDGAVGPADQRHSQWGGYSGGL